jgi:hypothetical protein
VFETVSNAFQTEALRREGCWKGFIEKMPIENTKHIYMFYLADCGED